MATPATRRTVLGVCPPDYRGDERFHFIRVAAEQVNGHWARPSDPNSRFPPNGMFYADLDVCRQFQADDLGVWEVEFHGVFQDRKAGTDFCAVQFVDSLIEVFTTELTSTAPDLRTSLEESGIRGRSARPDGQALLECQDGVVLRVRLVPDPDVPGRSVVPQGAAADPLDAWPSVKSLPLQSVSVNGKGRRFVDAGLLPAVADRLDLATWDEIFAAASRAGGLGSLAGPPATEARRAYEKLEQVRNAFGGPRWQSRRERLQRFLDEAGSAIGAREEFAQYLSGVPAFGKAVDAEADTRVSQLTERLRAEILERESGLVGRIRILGEQIAAREGDFDSVDQLIKARESELHLLVAEVERLTEEQRGLQSDVETARRLAGEIEQRRREVEGLTASARQENAAIAELTGRIQTLTRERETVDKEIAERKAQLAGLPLLGTALPEDAVPLFPVKVEATPFVGPETVAKLLKQNLVEVGVHTLMAGNLSVEATAAASLGLVLFTAGSAAEVLAEVLAVSLGGGTVRRYAVPVGATTPLQFGPFPTENPAALLLRGANLSCLDAYGPPLRRLVQTRLMTTPGTRSPVVVATLADGPSALPVRPDLLCLGPVFDTDALTWNLRPPKDPLTSRPWAKGTWTGGDADHTGPDLLALAARISGQPNVFWHTTARAFLRRLTCLSKQPPGARPEMSFAYTSLLPWLVANGVSPADHAESVLEALGGDRSKLDPRVARLLDLDGGDA